MHNLLSSKLFNFLTFVFILVQIPVIVMLVKTQTPTYQQKAQTPQSAGPSANLLKNFSFDQGMDGTAPASWVMQGTGAIQVDQLPNYAQNPIVKMTANTPAGISLSQSGMIIKGGFTYEVSGLVKGTVANTPYSIIVQEAVIPPNKLRQVDDTVGTDWKQFSLTVSVPQTIEASIAQVILQTTSSSPVYFDNLSFRRL